MFFKYKTHAKNYVGLNLSFHQIPKVPLFQAFTNSKREKNTFLAFNLFFTILNKLTFNVWMKELN